MYIKYIIQSLLNVHYIKAFLTKLFRTLELSAIGFKFSFCKGKNQIVLAVEKIVHRKR